MSDRETPRGVFAALLEWALAIPQAGDDYGDGDDGWSAERRAEWLARYDAADVEMVDGSNRVNYTDSYRALMAHLRARHRDIWEGARVLWGDPEKEPPQGVMTAPAARPSAGWVTAGTAPPACSTVVVSTVVVDRGGDLRDCEVLRRFEVNGQRYAEVRLL